MNDSLLNPLSNSIASCAALYRLRRTGQESAGASQTRHGCATVCHVQTGIEGGTVNLRTCAGVSCAVLDIVTEGEPLTILTAGAWAHVMTEDGVMGYINSKYCKGK